MLFRSGVGSALLRADGPPLFTDWAEYVAECTEQRGVGEVTPEAAVESWRAEAALFVDARDPTAYAEGHITGAVNVPVHAAETAQLPKDRPLVVYCDGPLCDKARTVALALAARGHRADVMPAGMEGWFMAGGGMEAGP